MLNPTIKSGSKAISRKDIGKLPAGTVVKVVWYDESKTTIEFAFNGYLQKFYLESGKFKMDFEMMKNFLESGDESTAQIQAKSRASAPNPHSKKYLYTSV